MLDQETKKRVIADETSRFMDGLDMKSRSHWMIHSRSPPTLSAAYSRRSLLLLLGSVPERLLAVPGSPQVLA